ncbi:MULTISPECIES: hypothetical protein [unclassified Streptomyces]|uniref:hypothetical protein n=1 Tax=unclassified Streptomyces TaxID=2593676 RepID=UPI003392C437
MTGNLEVVAGTLSTVVFVASTLPMIVKAVRTRDLSSYSGGNLILSNTGNLLYGVYVVSLPVGPAWALYAFNLSVSATMLMLWLRYKAVDRALGRVTEGVAPVGRTPALADAA